MNRSSMAQLSQLFCGPQSSHQQFRPAEVEPNTMTSHHPSQTDRDSPDSPLNANLLEHFLTHTINLFDSTPTISPKAYLDLANGAPYLLLQALATSARHLSTLKPSRKGHFNEQAQTLQRAALLAYTNVVREVTPANSAALLLFSSLLGVSRLFDAVSTTGNDTSVFLDRVCGFIDAQRGARLVAHQSWPVLCQSEIGPVLQAAQGSLTARDDAGRECDILHCLVEKGSMDKGCSEACRDAITGLQVCFDAVGTSEQSVSSIGVAFAWPATASQVFAEMLVRRTPEALVILAFYGRLLDQYRGVWFVANIGRQLIGHIATYLGISWASWLAWPKQSLWQSSML